MEKSFFFFSKYSFFGSQGHSGKLH
jgi:hypothetical protein